MSFGEYFDKGAGRAVCGEPSVGLGASPPFGPVLPLVGALPDGFGSWPRAALDAYSKMYVAGCELERAKLEVTLRELDIRRSEVDLRAAEATAAVRSPPSYSDRAPVAGWRSKVSSRAESVASWRSEAHASASGFSTEGGSEPADGSVCDGGRCYSLLAAEGRKSSLSRRCGKWPTVSRLLSLPAMEVSMAKLSEHVLVRSSGNRWHVAPSLAYPPATATVHDVLGRLVREFDDALQVGDPRWSGTVLEAVAAAPEPLGAFDLPDLSSRVGGLSASTGPPPAGFPGWPAGPLVLAAGGAGASSPRAVGERAGNAEAFVGWVRRVARWGSEVVPGDVGSLVHGLDQEWVAPMVTVGRYAIRAEAVSWYYVQEAAEPVALADNAFARLIASPEELGFEGFMSSDAGSVVDVYCAVAGLCHIQGAGSLRAFLRGTSFMRLSDLHLEVPPRPSLDDQVCGSSPLGFPSVVVSRDSPADVARWFGVRTRSAVGRSAFLLTTRAEVTRMCDAGAVVVCYDEQAGYVASELGVVPVALSEVSGCDYESVVFVSYDVPAARVPLVEGLSYRVKSLFFSHRRCLGFWCPQGLPAGFSDAFAGVVSALSLLDYMEP